MTVKEKMLHFKLTVLCYNVQYYTERTLVSQFAAPSIDQNTTQVVF